MKIRFNSRGRRRKCKNKRAKMDGTRGRGVGQEGGSGRCPSIPLSFSTPHLHLLPAALAIHQWVSREDRGPE